MSAKTTNFENNATKRQTPVKAFNTGANSTMSSSSAASNFKPGPAMLISKDFYDPLAQYDNLLKRTEENVSDLIYNMRKDQANSIRVGISKPQKALERK